jgi:hypothetical protein
LRTGTPPEIPLNSDEADWPVIALLPVAEYRRKRQTTGDRTGKYRKSMQI